MVEERELQRRLHELSDTVKGKREEAEAAAGRRAALLREVASLKQSLTTAEQADSARLAELQRDVAALEAGVAAARAGTASDPTPAAMRQAEEEARARERSRWQSELARVREEGERELSAVEEAGRRQYEALVADVEAKYTAEFHQQLTNLQEQQRRDEEEAARVEAQLAEVQGSVQATREALAARRKEFDALNKEKEEAEEAAKARLMELREQLRRVWTSKQVPTSNIIAFLKRLQGAMPYTAKVHDIYERKIEELQESTPILRAITRREVLQYRLAHASRSANDLLDRLAGAAPSASEQQQLQRWHDEHQSNARELAALDAQLTRDIRDWESRRGEAFMYRNRPFLRDMGAASGVAGAISPAMDTPALAHQGGAVRRY
jgi:hypothetical protein